jgi:hypothetical protein
MTHLGPNALNKSLINSVLDDDDQQDLNKMADNQIAVGLIFKREDTLVATSRFK